MEKTVGGNGGAASFLIANWPDLLLTSSTSLPSGRVYVYMRRLLSGAIPWLSSSSEEYSLSAVRWKYWKLARKLHIFHIYDILFPLVGSHACMNKVGYHVA
jgi:hypothetical protein